MKVTYVSTLTEGGPVSHLLNLAPRVAAAGARVRVLCGSDEVADRVRSLGLAAEAFPLRSKTDVVSAARLWPQLRGADIVHTQDRRALLLCGAVVRTATGAELVHTYHGLPEELVGLPGRPDARPAGSPLRAAWRLHGHLRFEALLARLGAVVVPSRALAKFLIGRGFPVSRMYMVPSRIDIRRTEPGAAHQPVRIATAARLETHKGIDVLLDACARLNGRTPLVHLDIYGDGSLRAELERRAAGSALDVTFHGNVSDVRERLLDADIFVLPSRGENLPITILEAMAVALPVVASRVGGVAELVDDGVSGRLVEPDDVAALAQALTPLIADSHQRAAMGRAGVARVAEHFDAAQAGAEMVALYERLLASPR
ncbi:MAG: glycosyltransferase family 4 protein [Candidatus Dormibacteraeota bacterium]|uniref:Glycosyltransferase family 4 protein n=1 Tax=Candidatus Aeolococcus gillhamiae TaxID=3127015 RepID=A0A934K3N3_9BACT|nr:glycosyltransferase family 4 protein [Candidatus Dormibacteraeota bacterium]